MNDIQIFPEELKVQIATDKGYFPSIGHKVTIQGIDLSFTATRGEELTLVVSSLNGGMRLTSFKLDFLSFALCDTKERTLHLFEKYAKRVNELINHYSKDEIIKKIDAANEKYEKEFGKMPEIQLYDMSDESLMNKRGIF